MPAAEEFNENADKPDDGEGDWFALEDGTFPSVPRKQTGELMAVRDRVDLNVEDTPGLRANEDNIKAALLILSQSGTGRKLAKAAIDGGYTLIFDPPQIGLDGPDENLSGLVDHPRKRVNLKSGGDPIALALVIAHELAHVSQVVNGGMPVPVMPYHPLASVKLLMAQEGDARAYEFLVALELSYPAMDDPAERLLFPQAIDVATERIGGAMPKKVIEHFKPQFPDDVARDEMMARVFKAFYASLSLRLDYERMALGAFARVKKTYPAAWQDEKNFTKEIGTDELLEMIDRHGAAVMHNATPYAQKFEKFIALDTPQMAALAPATLQAFGEIEKERHENPLTRNDRSWTDAYTYTVERAATTPPPKKAFTP